VETTSARTRWQAVLRYGRRLAPAATSAAGRAEWRLLAVLGIVALDAYMWRAPIPEAVLGVGDEICHVLTAALIVFAWPAKLCKPSRIRLVAALAASVLIDLDHLPKELFGATFLTAGTARPYGHTALAVIITCALAIIFRRFSNASNIAWGAALGIVLHLVRDLATGGAALAWPASFATVEYPYPLYALVLLVAAGWPRTRPTAAK
jgi:hypothetical protein